MSTFVTVVHIATCVFVVLFVLMQSGKGAEISASLAGSSQTVFGSSGGANFFTRATSVLAGIFMVTSMVLTILGSKERRSVFEGAAPTTATTAPASNPVLPAPGAPVPPAQKTSASEPNKK